MAAGEWLTLSEMARKAGMSESEARKIIRDFGNMLCARQFGDIIKYPAQAAELMALIRGRYEQGWSKENLRDLITAGYRETFEVKMPNLQSLYAELLQAVNGLMENLLPAFQQMQQTMQFVEDFIDSISALISRMAVQEEEIKTLRSKIVQ